MARKTKTKPATLGTRIKALRCERGMTQERLTHFAGCSKSTLARIEADETVPGTMTVAAIARALGVAPEALKGKQ